MNTSDQNRFAGSRIQNVRLSVIVPTYNRASTLAKCLRALADQNCDPADFEIIVSDDGSVDETASTVANFTEKSSVAVHYIYQNNCGANAARNRAIRLSNAPLLLFINDDVLPAADMLARHIGGHMTFPDDRVAILGRVTVSPELPSSRLSQLHLDLAYERLGTASEWDWRAFFTCNVSVKKSLLERGGYFEERIRYHEDLELGERLARCGLRVRYDPNALGFHHHYLTEAEFLAVADREGKALAVWSEISPHLRPMLGEFGFEPSLPAALRYRHCFLGWVFNPLWAPVWRSLARRCPDPLSQLSIAIYSQLYQSERRRVLRKELERRETNCTSATVHWQATKCPRVKRDTS